MRHIDRLPKPAILVEKEVEWQEKYEAKLAENPHARPDHSKYAHKQIKDTLYTMSYGKLDNEAISVTEALDPCKDSDEEIKETITFEREQICSVANSQKGLNTIKKFRLNIKT